MEKLNCKFYKMAASPVSISSLLIFGCVLFANNASFTSAHELILHGKIGDKPLVKFSSAEREIKMLCDLSDADIGDSGNGTNLKWAFMRNDKIVDPDIARACKGDRNDDSSKTNKSSGSLLQADCEVSYDKEKKQFVLELDDIGKDEFGKYLCYTGDMMNRNKTFILRELVHLTRKFINDHGKVKDQKSVTYLVGETFFLYCNATGLNKKDHKISWLRDGEDITDELNRKMDMFQNFTGKDLDFAGPAQLEHRGNYTCVVDSSDPETKQFYPIQFSFFVRVKEGNEWLVPMYVLLAEIALIGAFTAILNWREKRQNEDDIVIEDSEDEDEDVPKNINGAGTQNNNSNGSGSRK